MENYTIGARVSVSVSVSVPWNLSFIGRLAAGDKSKLAVYIIAESVRVGALPYVYGEETHSEVYAGSPPQLYRSTDSRRR